MSSKWRSKFKTESGKWIYAPTDEMVAVGEQIKRSIEERWTPPHYFFHLRSGGHVKALKQHLDNSYFLHLDIQNFFGSINRSRITRALKQIFPYKTARDWASTSTVRDPGNYSKFIIPFGFVQSQVIASLCLHQSALGVCMMKLIKNKNLVLSVYVDDIILSCNESQDCDIALTELIRAAERSNFTLNSTKMEGPAPSIKAFNIILSNKSLCLTKERFQLFERSLSEDATSYRMRGILNYVKSINEKQFEQLSELNNN